jgi:FAD dependent oxidoreductase
MKFAIIGAGWYGLHLAIELKKRGHEVTLFEKNSAILSEISGKFGVRLHVGLHYPRSEETRKTCQRAFKEFYDAYPELIVEHDYSMYGVGIRDANKKRSKVTSEEFRAIVQREISEWVEVDLKESEYKSLHALFNVKEPSIAVGARLQQFFDKQLKEVNLCVMFNFEVKTLRPSRGKVLLSNPDKYYEEIFDKVINTTSYQAFLLPAIKNDLDIDIIYQPCLALLYEDQVKTKHPFSFIVMDGWFPCIMPYNDSPEKDGRPNKHYILTHGKWTIMGSYSQMNEAYETLNKIDDAFIENKIKPKCEAEIGSFWPKFKTRFTYLGWKSSVLAKIATKKEFRSAVTFEENNIIHVIPGKVSNIFDVAREVFDLVDNINIMEHKGYHYVKNGVLHSSMMEIIEKPDSRSTCKLQTFEELHKVNKRPSSDFGEGASTSLFWARKKKQPVLVTDSPHLAEGSQQRM